MLATSVLAPIEKAVGWFIVVVHSGLASVAGDHQGWAWAVAIVALVAVIRIALFPLFAKQSRSMRQMQLLQPKVKEIQRKYSDDKATQQTELMKLYKETGVNPLGGCLPLVIQAPIFFALYRVLYSIKPPFHSTGGMTAGQAKDAGLSTLFGTPISAAFNSTEGYLNELATRYHAQVGSLATVKVVTALFIVAMSVATFITTRQSMARSQAAQAGSGADNPMMRQQKVLMYAMPVFLAVFGYRVPLGALIYWLSNNVFTMVQQHFLYRKMDAEAAGEAGAAKPAAGLPSQPLPAARPGLTAAAPSKGASRFGGKRARPSADGVSLDGSTAEAAPPELAEPAPAETAAAQRPWQSGPAKRAPANRGNRNRRNRRR